MSFGLVRNSPLLLRIILGEKRPFRNTNTGQKALSFIGPSFWNQIPETLKKTKNFNTFNHNLKKHFLNQMT